MNFDLRFPIGIMFSLFGALLAVFGLFSDPKLYERSLGININLWWGLVLLMFGAAMLALACRARSKDASPPPKRDAATD